MLSRHLAVYVTLTLALSAVSIGSRAAFTQGAVAPEPITIPFELATRHVILKITVNNSRPLSFVLDSGADVAIVRLAVAEELGLTLEAGANVRGAGAGTQAASLVKDANWSLVGLAGFSQPVSVALPMPGLPAALGRDVDGIIGGQFIQKFVLELDYQARHIRLHDPASFRYTGPGQVVPVELVNTTHPTIQARVTPRGGTPIEGRFLFDIGAGSALVLHSPFVAHRNLLETGLPTIRAIGGAGAGGRTTGRLGRVDSLQIGSYLLERPIALFSQDKAGAFANAALAGNIGAQVAMRFRTFLDYTRRRVILEPTPETNRPFDRAFSGVALRAVGADYRTLRVIDVLEDSPATEAGLREEDVIMAIEGVAPVDLTLSRVSEMFDKEASYRVTVRRGIETIVVTLTPRKLI